MAETQYAMQKKVSFSPYSFLELCRDKFPHFTNRALISFIFEWESTRKPFFAELSREGIARGCGRGGRRNYPRNL